MRADGRDRKEYYKQYYETNREKLIKQNNDNARKRGRQGEHYKERYGITEDDFQRMMIEQNGVCAICESPPKNVRLHVDHDHDTFVVRGLLCTKCNTVLHYLEKPGWLLRALRYLFRSGFVVEGIKPVVK